MDDVETTTTAATTTRRRRSKGEEFAAAKAREWEERQARQATTATPAAPAAPVMLPAWPDAVRGVPTSVLRSALFGVIQRGPRAYQDGVRKTSVDGVTVIHTGPQLDQADLDVWEQCLHLARTGGLGVEIRFTGNAFLKAIGRGTGKAQHEWLKKALRRLMTSLVELQEGGPAYAGQLIHHWARDDDTGHHVMTLNPKIAALYSANGGWSQVEWSERQALRKLPLAQWLHGYYTTHAKPYPVKVETIRTLCGSEAGRLADFRRDLRDALARLAAATGWSWEIDDADLVHIAKKPSRSQARHLKKAKATATV